MSSPLIHIQPVDNSVLFVAQQLHAIQMSAYAQEAMLLGAVCFPPLERTVEEVQSSAERFFSAHVGGIIVGAIGVSSDEEGMGMNIASMVVAPAFQRMGVGSRLLAAVLTAHGRGVLTVQTGVKNSPALALYAQAGFVEINRWFVGREPIELAKLRRDGVSTRHAGQ